MIKNASPEKDRPMKIGLITTNTHVVEDNGHSGSILTIVRPSWPNLKGQFDQAVNFWPAGHSLSPKLCTWRICVSPDMKIRYGLSLNPPPPPPFSHLLPISTGGTSWQIEVLLLITKYQTAQENNWDRNTDGTHMRNSISLPSNSIHLERNFHTSDSYYCNI